MADCFINGHTWEFLGDYLVCKFCGKQVIRSKEIRYKKAFKWSDPRWCEMCGKVVTGGCPHCN
jgi:hypothetical protein